MKKFFHPIILLLIAIAIMIISEIYMMSSVGAAPTPVLSCMGGRISDVNLVGWNDMALTYGTFPVDDAAVNGFYNLIGEDIWLGYPEDGEEYVHGQHGFDVPEDNQRLFKLLGIGDQGQNVEVWVHTSNTTPDTLYFFPFRTTELFARSDGSNYGMHPCGAYAVAATDVNPIVDAVFTNSAG